MWFCAFLLNAFVKRVNRRIDIRMVRFWRSICEVLMCFGSGLPCRTSTVMPVHSARAKALRLLTDSASYAKRHPRPAGKIYHAGRDGRQLEANALYKPNKAACHMGYS